jgi:hypothetical protein
MTTEYRVLRRTSTSGNLSEVGVHECNGPSQAIRHFVEQSDQPVASPSNFVAVPVRNWTEIQVATETPQPKLVMKEVEPPNAQVTIDEVLADEHSVKAPEAA